MKTIRKHVFETNSSSSHALIYNGYSPATERELEMKGGEFGWEWRKYRDAQSRLSYMLTAALDIFSIEEIKEYAENIRVYFEERDVEIDNSWLDGLYFKKYAGDGDGGYIKHETDYFYIDHQSAPGEDEVCMELAKSFAEPEKVWDYVTDDGNEIDTGNDNEPPPKNWDEM